MTVDDVGVVVVVVVVVVIVGRLRRGHRRPVQRPLQRHQEIGHGDGVGAVREHRIRAGQPTPARLFQRGRGDGGLFRRDVRRVVRGHWSPAVQEIVTVVTAVHVVVVAAL